MTTTTTGLRLSVDCAEFAEALRQAGRAIPTKTPLDVCKYVLLDASGGTLRMSATDLAAAITVTLDATIDGDGGALAPYDKLSVIAAEMSGQLEMVYDAKRRRLSVKSGSKLAEMACLDADDFPPVPVPDSVSSGRLEIDGETFAELIRMGGMSAGNEHSSSPWMRAISLTAGEGQATLVSADGYRLSRVEIEIAPGQALPKLLLPADGMREIATLFADAKEPVKCSFSDRRAWFTSGTISASLLEMNATFPTYEQFITKDGGLQVSADREALLGAVSLAKAFSDGRGLIFFDVSEDALTIGSMVEGDSGESSTALEAQIVMPEGAPLNPIYVAMNERYILEWLRRSKAVRVVLRIAGQTEPVIFTEEGAATGDLYVVMPMFVTKKGVVL